MKKKILAIVAAMVAPFAFMAPAHANTGVMSIPEFQSVCTPDMNFTAGCNRANFQSEVQDDCNCTGHVTDNWTNNGRPYKTVSYTNNVAWPDLITYKQRASDDKWQVVAKSYCDWSGCYSKFPY